jgi:hypothetical protein
MIRFAKSLFRRLTRTSWHLGFVNGGLHSVFNDFPLSVSWVQSPYKDRWFADPFILDVSNESIIVLAEEVRYNCPKGRIVKLTIDREDLAIQKRETLLETETHLSFPSIFRYNGKVYITPENAQEGKQHLYEYDSESGTLHFVQTICEDCVWDATITDSFDHRFFMFASHKNDYSLDIYSWDDEKKRFVSMQSVLSNEKNSRMGGSVFTFKGQLYAPFQNCSRTYGGNLDIKAINYKNGVFDFCLVKQLFSPHPKYKEGLHTLNEYKGVVIVDVIGFNSFWGRVISTLSKSVHRIIGRKVTP